MQTSKDVDRTNIKEYAGDTSESDAKNFLYLDADEIITIDNKQEITPEIAAQLTPQMLAQVKAQIANTPPLKIPNHFSHLLRISTSFEVAER